MNNLHNGPRGPFARDIGIALALTLSLSSCINVDTHLYEVNIHGTINVNVDVDEDTPKSGKVHIELRHANSGEGALSHPLSPITEFEIEGLGDFEESVLIPTDEGKGLVIYAWLDSDGDGTLCGLGATPEPAGLLAFDVLDTHDVEVDLLLTEPCAGAESLYP